MGKALQLWDALREMGALPAYWKAARGKPLSPAKESKHAYGPHRQQYVLKRSPIQITRATTVIFIHGGGWQFGRPEQFRHHAMFFNELGYEVWMPSLRRLPAHHIGHMRDDLASILKMAVAQSKGKLIWAGVSSGGHLSALAVADHALLSKANFDPERIAGLLLIGAPLFVSRLPWLSPRIGLTHGSAERSELIDPGKLLPSVYPIAVLGIYGDEDGLVPPHTGLAPLRHLGEHIRYRSWPGTGHMDVARWAIDKPEMANEVSRWLAEIEKGMIG